MRTWPLLYHCNAWLFQTVYFSYSFLLYFPWSHHLPVFHPVTTAVFLLHSAPGLAPAQAKPAARLWQIKRSELSAFKPAAQQIKAVCLCSAHCSGKERPFSQRALHCKSPWQHEQPSKKSWPLLKHQLHSLLPFSSKLQFWDSSAIKVAGEKKSSSINPAQSLQQHLKLSKQRVFCLQVSNSQGQILILL